MLQYFYKRLKVVKQMRIRKKKHLEERLEQVNRVLLNPPRDVLNVKLAVQDKKYFNAILFFFAILLKRKINVKIPR